MQYACNQDDGRGPSLVTLLALSRASIAQKDWTYPKKTWRNNSSPRRECFVEARQYQYDNTDNNESDCFGIRPYDHQHAGQTPHLALSFSTLTHR